METKSRKPVDEDHPVIEACLHVFGGVGGPLKVTRLFRLANAEGLLPDSASNTIRGRLSQHVQHARRDGRDPAIVRLPKRRGWMRLTGRLRDVAVSAEWVQDAKAPGALRAFVRDHAGYGDPSPSVLRVLVESGLDDESITWLLETLPFDPALRARLEQAADVRERREVLDEAG